MKGVGHELKEPQRVKTEVNKNYRQEATLV
jgi:hypothetical protein